MPFCRGRRRRRRMSMVEQPPSSLSPLSVAMHREDSTSGLSPVRTCGTVTSGGGFSPARSVLSSDMEHMQRNQRRDQRRVCAGFIIAAIGISCIVITVILLLSNSRVREKQVSTEARKHPKVEADNYTSAMRPILMQLQQNRDSVLRAH